MLLDLAKEENDDDTYQGARHTSYVPGWMIGEFEGYNPTFNADIRMRIDHRPAETIQVDWVGDTAEVVDPDTGDYCSAFATPFHAPLLQRSMADCHTLTI